MEPAFSGAYFFLLSDFSHLERWLTSFTLVRCEEHRIEKFHFFFYREKTNGKEEERGETQTTSMMIIMMTMMINVN